MALPMKLINVEPNLCMAIHGNVVADNKKLQQIIVDNNNKIIYK